MTKRKTTKLMLTIEAILASISSGKAPQQARVKTDLQMIKPRASQIPNNRRDDQRH